MNAINWTNVRLILMREIRDQLRDRRTLFMIAVLPLLLYPLMGMSFMQLAQFLKKNPSSVLLVAEDGLPTEPPLVVDGRFVTVSDREADLLHVEVRKTELADFAKAQKQAKVAIDQGAYDVIVCLPSGFNDLLSSGEAAGSQSESVAEPSEVDENNLADAKNENTIADSGDDSAECQPIVYYNAAKDRSRIAYERLSVAMHRWRQKVSSSKKIERRKVAARPAMPFTMTAEDVAEPVGRRAAIWSKILPFVALVWALTGAFYPAVDLCAGEKERGTLETLLSSPAERSEIVWGKLLTVMTFSFTTSLLNLFCMTFTATFALHQFQGMMNESSLRLMGPPPISSVGWLVIAIIPIVALFSALSLALATLARSTREGQYYLMPLLLTTMPLMMLAMFPSAELDLGSSIIPVTGVMLLLRQLMEGEYREALIYLVPVMTVTIGCCLMAIRWAIDQFKNENVLFRASERFELSLWFKQLVRDRAATPSVAEAMMCGVLLLLIRFFASLSMPFPSDWNGFMVLTILTMVAFIATPPLLMAIMLTTDMRQTLLLKKFDWKSSVIAVLFAITLHPITMGLSTVIRILYPVDTSALKPFESLFAQAPSLWVIILLMAVLPAICEEIAFRGFILSGLRHMGRKWRAIFVSAMFFGIAHGVIQQSLLAVTAGMVLGYIAVQSGSLLPCIAFHATHNTLGILANQYIPSLLAEKPQFSWLIPTVNDLANGGMFYYGPPIMLCAFILSAGCVRWFSNLEYQPTAEERVVNLRKQQMQALPA